MRNFHNLSRVERRAFPGAQVTYTDLPVIPDAETIWLTSRDDHGDWISGLFVPGDRSPGQCLLHFYAGNENLAGMQPFIRTCREHGLSVLMFDYRGYGASRGRPREAAFYADAELIFDWLSERHPEQSVIISGRALGTGVAVYLARQRDARGLVLLSPFTSMMDVVGDIFPKDEIVIEEAMPFVFDNLERIRKVTCPVLIVSGTKDTVTPRRMTRDLARAAKSPVTRLDVPGAGHHDLFERRAELVWRAMLKFIDAL